VLKLHCAQVACLSRAGREPGFKKTNQDNCFAFEKYLGDDKSLFAAMDGHGPNGEDCHSMLITNN
jgi:serine/threonine protein phosphatase PrpC